MSKATTITLSSTPDVSRLVRQLIRSLGRVQTTSLLKAINEGAVLQDINRIYPLSPYHINLLRTLDDTPQKHAQ